MLRFRLQIGAFVGWLFVLYNLERINEPTINIATFVYILAPVTAGILMIRPQAFMRRRILLLIAPTLVVYFVLKVVLGYDIAGPALPVSVLEIDALVVTLLLAQLIGASVTDFEDTIVKLTFQQIGLPARFYETLHSEDLYREVKRSRRFQHPLVVLVVEPDLTKTDFPLNKLLIDLQKTMVNRYTQARVAKLLTEELRDTDLVVQSGQNFVVLLVETVLDEAKTTVERLKAQAADDLGIDLHVGLADFPDSGVTFWGLLDAANVNLKSSKD